MSASTVKARCAMESVTTFSVLPTTHTSDGTRHVRPSVFPGTTAHRIVAPGAMPSSHSTFASNLPSPTGVKR